MKYSLLIWGNKLVRYQILYKNNIKFYTKISPNFQPYVFYKLPGLKFLCSNIKIISSFLLKIKSKALVQGYTSMSTQAQGSIPAHTVCIHMLPQNTRYKVMFSQCRDMVSCQRNCEMSSGTLTSI
jgi:hypothetical protein